MVIRLMLYDAHKEQTQTAEELVMPAVGMEKIRLPILYGEMTLLADVEVFVNLKDIKARGIHMSRLYSWVSDQLAGRSLTWPRMLESLKALMESQEGLSSEAMLGFDFELPLQRQSLKSQTHSFKTYKVAVRAVKDSASSEPRLLASFQIPYSSTCPQSAALARQLIQNRFDIDFQSTKVSKTNVHQWLGSITGIVATPHAQRSYADVLVEVASANSNLDFVSWIDGVEEVLGTAVQALVKRADEQEFALRNGQNLMFCEDAARRVGGYLAAQVSSGHLKNYFAKLSHHESLHNHNATAFVQNSNELKSYFQS